MSYLIVASLFLITLFLNAHSFAQTNTTSLEQKVILLDEINKSAERICLQAPPDGSSEILSLEGEAGATLNALLQRAIELGIEGAAKYRSENYAGVLREELGETIRHSNNCRLQVFDRLSIILLSSPGNTSILDSRIQTTSLPAQENLQYVNEYFAAAVTTVSQSANGQWLNISFLLKNTTKDPLYILYEDKFPSEVIAFDDTGNSFFFDRVSGIDRYRKGDDPADWTRIGSSAIQTVLLRLEGNRSQDHANIVSFAMNLFVSKGGDESTQIAIGMSNVAVIKK